jgi:hypothetical protein
MASYPPYGQFARIYKDSVDINSLAPEAWRPTVSKPERESSWMLWRNETVKIINETLWPKWDETTRSWHNADTTSMDALTIADFELFSVINAAGILDRQPVSPVAAKAIPTHRQFFSDEDTAKLGERYYFYDTTLPTEQLDKIVPDLKLALKQKAGSVSIQIKTILQRPRAYQVAKIIGREHKFELAATSMTSSMSSGHCFQGCLAAAGIYEAWLSRGFAPSSEQLAALAQFGMDIGDRRVFAGVHFPSDNMASWIMDLRLIREVCPNPAIAAFLKKAIIEQSYVFRIIRDSKNPVYDAGLDAIASISV